MSFNFLKKHRDVKRYSAGANTIDNIPKENNYRRRRLSGVPSPSLLLPLNISENDGSLTADIGSSPFSDIYSPGRSGSLSSAFCEDTFYDRRNSKAAQDLLSDKYVCAHYIGEGTSSIVRFGVRRSDGKCVAIKILKNVDEEKVMLAIDEYEMLSKFKHKNIITIFDYITCNGFYFAALVYESSFISLNLNKFIDHVLSAPRIAFLEKFSHHKAVPKTPKVRFKKSSRNNISTTSHTSQGDVIRSNTHCATHVMHDQPHYLLASSVFPDAETERSEDGSEDALDLPDKTRISSATSPPVITKVRKIRSLTEADTVKRNRQMVKINKRKKYRKNTSTINDDTIAYLSGHYKQVEQRPSVFEDDESYSNDEDEHHSSLPQSPMELLSPFFTTREYNLIGKNHKRTELKLLSRHKCRRNLELRKLRKATVSIKNDLYTEEILVFVLKEIACGLNYLHEDRKFMHRDIKGENILLYTNDAVESGLVVKIVDFNCARARPETGVKHASLSRTRSDISRLSSEIHSEDVDNELCLSMAGTPENRAPEMLIHTMYDCGVDIWALGILFFRLAARNKSPPFVIASDDTSEYINSMRSLESDADWKERLVETGCVLRMLPSKHFLRILSKCCVVEPSGRWSAKNILDFIECSFSSDVLRHHTHILLKVYSSVIFRGTQL